MTAEDSHTAQSSLQFQNFQNLMRRRIRDVLLVSSLYDSFIFEEDGTLHDLIHHEYSDLNLGHSPDFIRVSGGNEALAMLGEGRTFDLIIATPHLEDMHPLQFVKQVQDRRVAIPVVLLAFDNRELADLLVHPQVSLFSGIFVWQGDFRLIIAIIKQVEDRMNVVHDTGTAGIQLIILIEDSIRWYSSFLPLMYTEIMKQSLRLISEGVNPSHKFLRMRARPKILLCTRYEEAWQYFNEYEEQILGVISDVDFQRNGQQDPEAGILFARMVKAKHSDIPILLQSNSPANALKAHSAGALFVLKDSQFLLREVRNFIEQYFGFGDFIFRLPDGTEAGRASDLTSLESRIRAVPDESLRYHGERNHFSRWLKARTEFWLAHELRPRKVSDYASMTELREDLLSSLHAYRRKQQQGVIADFQQRSFDPQSTFARIGGGSLGGKARGLGFLARLLAEHDFGDKFPGAEVVIPPAVVLCTDVFDDFLEMNNLRLLAMGSTDDDEILKEFMQRQEFPSKVRAKLKDFLELVHEPLAVRSSSLLEDSQYQPYAGVYDTCMIPNNASSTSARLTQLIDAVKHVYASTFFQRAKDYSKATTYRLEEEKMAVILQKIVGTRYGTRFYPTCAGVARSYNFYPLPPQRPSEGIVSVAMGLGKMVVEGGPAVRFSPAYPEHLQQFSVRDEAAANNQYDFFALDMDAGIRHSRFEEDTNIKRYPLAAAEADGTLKYVGSTYSNENDSVYDGISREGTRLVTFAPLLKNKLVPLPEILDELLKVTSASMGMAIEMEFAVNLDVPEGTRVQLGLLQMRPLAVQRELGDFHSAFVDPARILCRSPQVLGNGIIDTIYDVVLVDKEVFDRSRSREVAQEVSEFNAKLIEEGKPYILIGVGRWGTLDPWLGIPVRWDQISGARVIVESGLKDILVTPSQGSHFFHNLTAFMVGYFTINPMTGPGFIDWQWLAGQAAVESKSYTKHLRWSNPLIVRMNGHEENGTILKPDR